MEERLIQCQEMLENTRQQCTKKGYATIGTVPYCRLHYSFRMTDKEQFDAEHEVCEAIDTSNLNRLMDFFKVVHEAKDEKGATLIKIDKK